jgi:Family of unknown function (DUF5686)/CarboxypepD_reg-like domain
MKLTFTLLFCIFSTGVFAQKITGTVKDEKGNPLSYASVLIKNTSRGTTANQNGFFNFSAEPGVYTLVCRYIGYTAQEKQVTVTTADVAIEFILPVQTIKQQTAIVKGGGEDPAYTIMRKAIQKRTTYNNEVTAFICDAYIKSHGKLLDAPKKMFGKKVEADEVKDSAGRKLLFLTESFTRVYYKEPDLKLEVLSGRNSQSASGFGVNFPTFINFYVNNVNISPQLSPRGFISPVNDNAIRYYKFKYLGYFTEDGKEINRIQVTPRRNNEPCFTGIINIVDDSWRIHSLALSVNKTNGMELLDSIAIQQQFVPVGDVYRLKDNIVTARFKQFGFNMQFNLVNIYQDYQLNPVFPPKFFGKMLMKYDTAFNKKDSVYWEKNRPVPLDTIEIKDYREKDSIRTAENMDSAWRKKYVDSMRRKFNRVSIPKLLYTGYRYGYPVPHKGYNMVFSLQPILFTGIEFNTAEGMAYSLHPAWEINYKKQRRRLTFAPHIRYGSSNKHVNVWVDIGYSKRDSVTRSWNLEAGKRVFQFNHDNPVNRVLTAMSGGKYGQNYMKIYEAVTGTLSYTRNNQLGFEYKMGASFEDRLPLENTIGDVTKITPNYPFEILKEQFKRHQAFSIHAKVSYQPGVRYIQLPNTRVSLASSKPVFSLEYTKGIKNIVGSDVDYDKWKFSIKDSKNLKLAGMFKYYIAAGGFLNTRSVQVQDMQHFNGNQLLFASEYLNSFQLAPYYANSNTAPLFGTLHVEHHFNGLITNKIPLFNRLKWHLTTGSNIFYVNKNNNYAEVFVGLENIFKLFRVDLVYGYKNGVRGDFAVRIGAGGLLSRMLQR